MTILQRQLLGPFSLFSEIEKMFEMSPAQTYPPFNLIRESDDVIRLEFAVAGFSKKEISVTVDNRRLIIQGEKTEKTEETFIHRGIATRKFSRVFTLPEFVEAEGAHMEDGILRINLKKHVPEERKPKALTIK